MSGRLGPLTVVVGSLVLAALVIYPGCDRHSSQTPSGSRGSRPRSSSRDNSAVLVATIARTLNNLPEEVVLDLAPPVPILDDSKSSDGMEVLATLDVTPEVPDGPFNYLSVPKGNADFRQVGVRPGDVVRYFVKRDQESAERGYEQLGYFELPVRRLDVNNPDNALIVEGGLNAPVQYPARVEIWRFSDRRMNEVRQRLNRYVQRPKDRTAWEPSPDESALLQLVERANQWFRNLKKDAEWQSDPLIESLPNQLRESKVLERVFQGLAGGTFELVDVRQLQQAIWIRDISQWAKASSVSDLDRAKALFDWTIRNIQLDPEENSGTVHQPWQALMYGHGSAQQRAWVFAELCRQQQLDVVILAFFSDQEDGSDASWWIPALFTDDKFYLFDAQLGLPIPGQNEGEVATLTSFLEDFVNSRATLELEEAETPYLPVDKPDRVEAWLVSSPLQLSLRANLLQAALEGNDFVVLSAVNGELTQQLKKHASIDDVQLWSHPFQAILDETRMPPDARLEAARRFQVLAQRPQLWKARVLHFQGDKQIPQDQRDDPLAQPNLGHAQATQFYQNPLVRPRDSVLEKLPESKREVYARAKRDAGYWVGLLSFDLGKMRPAEDWLARRTLEADPDGFWTPGARYNLARTYEAMGKLSEAMVLLRTGPSPQHHGNLLRARLLENQLREQPTTD